MNYQKFETKDLLNFIAKELWFNKVVAIFRGKSEMGPRSLCNRSILANPCWKDVKDYLNNTIKFRESFRPFAPVVTFESVSDYFEWNKPSPYMTFSVTVKKEYRYDLPGITHVDGTARIQTVTREQNEFAYDLLQEFRNWSRFPILLNTSFNQDGQSICETPKDCIETFQKSKLDYLIMNEKYLVSK